jgi:hypothetical protein
MVGLNGQLVFLSLASIEASYYHVWRHISLFIKMENRLGICDSLQYL